MSVLTSIDHLLIRCAVVLLLAAGVLLLVRIARGPSMLDRALALDVCAALIIAGLGAESASSRAPYYFPIMLVLALLCFTGSVAIARFIAVRDRPPRPPRAPAGGSSTEHGDGGQGGRGGHGGGTGR